MKVKPIAHSYFRRILDGAKKYKDVPKSLKSDVKKLLENAVADGILAPERYDEVVKE